MERPCLKRTSHISLFKRVSSRSLLFMASVSEPKLSAIRHWDAMGLLEGTMIRKANPEPKQLLLVGRHGKNLFQAHFYLRDFFLRSHLHVHGTAPSRKLR